MVYLKETAMLHALEPLSLPLVFLVANVVMLLFILWHNRRLSAPMEDRPVQIPPQSANLDPSGILGWEFEYARTTASESMQDRHTMTNFYLLIVGVVASGVVTLLTSNVELGGNATLRNIIGTVLLWLLCFVGWFYFLSIIRLRQAWYDSTRAMNRIKDFCIRHTSSIDPNVLRMAFLWQPFTMPHPGKPWTVHFYAAILIGFLSSAAFVAGGFLILMVLNALPPDNLWSGILLVALGFLFFAFHVWLYFAFLALRPAPAAPPR
jgi:hypothetical protein